MRAWQFRHWVELRCSPVSEPRAAHHYAALQETEGGETEGGGRAHLRRARAVSEGGETVPTVTPRDGLMQGVDHH